MRAEALRGDRERGAAAAPGGLDEAAALEAEAAGLPREQREYRVAATGARATLDSAKSLLFHFCNKLPSDRRGALRPVPEPSARDQSRACEGLRRSGDQGAAWQPCVQVMPARADPLLLRVLQQEARTLMQQSARGTHPGRT